MVGRAHRSGAIALAIALAINAATARGSAQEDPPAEPGEGAEAAYDAHVREAVAAYAARDFEASLAAFDRAFAILPTPRVLRGIGMCQIELGRFADAHRSLRAALDPGADDRALDAELRANVENVLLPLVRSRLALWVVPEHIAVELDGAAVTPDENRVVVAEPGTHELVVRADDGRSARATVEARAGHVGPLPLALAEPPPQPAPAPPRPPPAPVVRIAPGVSVVRDRGLGDYTPRVIPTRFALWAHGTLGAWQGGAAYSPAAGLGLTVALMTRFAPEVSVGGQLEGTWAGLLETCGPYAIDDRVLRTSETCGWYRTSVRIAVETHLRDVPISLVIAVGPGVGFRGTQTLGADTYAQSSRADVFLALDGGARWYVVDDVLFLGADVRAAMGDYADVGGAVLVGARIP